MWLYENTTMHAVDSTSDKFIASGKWKCKFVCKLIYGKLVELIYWISACETTYPICVKWYGKFYPASGVFFLAWLLAFTKSFGWLVCCIVGLFTCKQTCARRVVKFYCHSWSPISEDLHVKAHVKPHVKCMWK